jgi:predicted O-methyltransferase YrrM
VAGLLATAIVGLGVAVASAAGRAPRATSLLARLLVALPAGVIHLSRRLGGVGRANREAVRDLRVLVEQVQRRVIAAGEKERLAAGDRHQELTEALSRAERLTGRGAELLLREQTREIEALFQLFQRVTPRAPMPAGGALNPTDLLGLLHLVRTRKPQLVLELGSGTSTVWLAYLLQQTGGRLVSLDHEPGYAQKTRDALEEHGLTDVAEVRDAPLRPVVLDGRTFPWYDAGACADLEDVDLLVIDGPPEKTGPDARYPAMRVLEDRLADRATILFDDANRADEQAALRRWVETIEGLTREGEALGRHAVLSYRRLSSRNPACSTASR